MFNRDISLETQYKRYIAIGDVDSANALADLYPDVLKLTKQFKRINKMRGHNVDLADQIPTTVANYATPTVRDLMLEVVRKHPKSSFTAGLAGVGTIGAGIYQYFPDIISSISNFVSAGVKGISNLKEGLELYEKANKAYQFIYPEEAKKSAINGLTQSEPITDNNKIAKGLELASLISKNLFTDRRASDLLLKLSQIVFKEGLEGIPRNLFLILEPMIERGGDPNLNPQDLRKVARDNFSDAYTKEQFRAKTQTQVPYYYGDRNTGVLMTANQILKEDIKVHNTQNERGSITKPKDIPITKRTPKKLIISKNRR